MVLFSICCKVVKKVNQFLYLACAGGRLFRLDIATGKAQLIYQHPDYQPLMGLVIKKDQLYFGGQTFLGKGVLRNAKIEDLKIKEFYPSHWKKPHQLMKNFWSKIVRVDSCAMKYVNPQFHQMNFYDDKIYVTVTGRNEVWELNEELELLRCIVIQPHIADYNHVNNVFFDGEFFYVGLARYGRKLGSGGFAKLDKDWVEIERQSLGWESHGFCLIGEKRFHLCSSSGSLIGVTHEGPLFHPHRAGLMVDDEIVFEYDPAKFFCKDFSIDENYIYVVGGGVKPRDERMGTPGTVFVLNHDFELLKTHTLQKSGGIGGCQLSSQDYTNGSVGLCSSN